MLRRTLVLVLCFGALVAVAGVPAVSAKDSETDPVTFQPFPPYWSVPLAGVCTYTVDGSVVNIDCHNTDPNPTPPKDKVLLKGTCGSVGERSGKITLYPDGRITIFCFFRLSHK